VRIGRITLRRLLCIITAVAVLLAWYCHAAKRQVQAAQYLRLRGAVVAYEDEFRSAPSERRSWLASTLGRDYAFNVIGVQCPGGWSLCDDDCAMLSAFPRLDYLVVQGESTTNASLKTIGSLKKLTSVSFFRCAITDDGLASLGDLRNLRSLDLLDTPVTGLGLVHLKRCTQLERLGLACSKLVPEAFARIGTFSNLRELYLDWTGATDDCVCLLQGLDRLERLSLDSNPITDRCVQYIACLPQLNSFSAKDTHLTHEAVHRLKRLRPNLSVYVDSRSK